MNKWKKLSPEVRERAVRLVLEHRRVAVAVGLHAADRAQERLRAAHAVRLRRPHEVGSGTRECVTSAEKERVKALEQRSQGAAPDQRDPDAGQRVFSPMRCSTAG